MNAAVAIGVALVAAAATLRAQDDAAFVAQRAFVEVAAERDSYFVQQPIRLRLRFCIDRAFLRDNVLQQFRQNLDVPVRVEARWLDALPGTVALASGAATGASFVLNDERALARAVADVERDGRTFAAFEIERRYLPDRPGRLELPPPLLLFAYATRFREDFFGDRVAEDKREASVPGTGASLQIVPLPETGRPAAFVDAVGRFTLRAAATPTEFAAGDSMKLTLHIEGEGNLHTLTPPALDAAVGFHVFGKVENSDAQRRTIEYDVTPLRATIDAVPPLELAFFDPTPPAAYRTVRTAPIPLAVRPSTGGALPVAPAPTAVARNDDIRDLKPSDASGEPGSRPPSTLQVGLLLLAPWLLALGLIGHRRARLARDPRDERAAAAAAACRAGLRAANADVAGAITAYLAARLRCNPAAVIAPDLPARLIAAGVPSELAMRTARRFDELVDARFGGARPAASAAVATSLLDELEAVFRRTQ